MVLDGGRGGQQEAARLTYDSRKMKRTEETES